MTPPPVRAGLADAPPELEPLTARPARAHGPALPKPGRAAVPPAFAVPGPGSPLPSPYRTRMEMGFHHDFREVRVHADGAAARSADRLATRAYAVGPHVVLGADAPHPGAPGHDRLMAHELAHVIQSRGAPPVLRCEPPVGQHLAPGQTVEVLVYPAVGDPADDYASGTFTVQADGAISLGFSHVVVPVAGTAPDRLPMRIADALGQFYVYPTVEVRIAGRSWSGTPSTPRPEPPRPAEPPPSAALPPDPKAAKLLEFADVFAAASRLAEGESDTAERLRTYEALRTFGDWIDAHKGTDAFLTADAVQVWSAIDHKSRMAKIDADVRQDLERQRSAEAAETHLVQQTAYFDRFWAVAMDLWGYSSRKFPYLIEVKSEGYDILVTGDPMTQIVLDALATEFMNGCADDIRRGDLTATPQARLLELLQHQGYGKALRDAQLSPLQSEKLARHDLIPSKVAAAFGVTLAAGLTIAALAGVAVGLGVPALVVAGVLLTFAGAMWVYEFTQRYQEVKTQDYDVSAVPIAAVEAAGDVVGLSQLIEGVSGEQLGTGKRLDAVERSNKLGVGAGSIATLVVGSRSYNAGRSFGGGLRGPAASAGAGELGATAVPEASGPKATGAIDGPTPPPARSTVMEPLAGPSLESAQRIGRETGAQVIASEGRNPPSAATRASHEAAGNVFVGRNAPPEIAAESLDAAFVRFPLKSADATSLHAMGELGAIQAAMREAPGESAAAVATHLDEAGEAYLARLWRDAMRAAPDAPRGEVFRRFTTEYVNDVETVEVLGPYMLERLKPGGTFEIVYWEGEIAAEVAALGRLRYTGADGATYGWRIGPTEAVPRASYPESGFGLPQRATKVSRVVLEKVEVKQ